MVSNSNCLGINSLYKKQASAISLMVCLLILFFSTSSSASKGDFDLNYRNGEILVSNLLTSEVKCGLESFVLYGINEIIPIYNGTMISVLIRQSQQPHAVQSILVKLNLDGSVNSNFGENGYFCVNDIAISKMSVSTDGTILLAGAYYSFDFGGEAGYGGYQVGKITSQGEWDNNFGVNGVSKVTWPEEPQVTGWSVPEFIKQLDNDDIKIYGRIVYADLYVQPVSLALSNNGNAPLLTRLTPYPGAPHFGSGTVALANGDWYQSMAVEFSDEVAQSSQQSRSFVRKYFDNGELDVNFGTSGELDIVPAGYSFIPREILLQKNQKLLISGNGFPFDDETKQEIRLIRLEFDGSHDSSFPEFVSLALPTESVPDGFSQDLDVSLHTADLEEDIIVSANVNQIIYDSSSSTINNSRLLFALNSQGELLSDIFSNGVLNLGDDFAVSSMAKQSDGKLLLAGDCNVNEIWFPCLKSMNWDNIESEEIPEVKPPKSSGGGSLAITVILFGFLGVLLLREKLEI